MTTHPFIVPAMEQTNIDIELIQDSRGGLIDHFVQSFRTMIERRYRRHNHRSGTLRSQHIFQVDAVERRIPHAQHQFASFLQHHIRRARNEIIAHARGNGPQRSHGTGDHHHRIYIMAARSDRRSHIPIGKHFNLARSRFQNPRR